jgi:tRNA 2-thiocytidine biosynthesis protein TtcA
MNLSKEQLLERTIIRRFHKALTSYSLIDNGDHILIGVSGGFDSLCLMEMLGRRMKIQRPNFTLDAIHVKMSNIDYATDDKFLNDFAASLNIPLHIVTTSFDETTDKRKSPCFLCSWNRRKQMFNLAQELGCNKIALGHHADDIIQTAMMNLFFQGQFSSIPAKLTMRKMPLTIIHPLCLEKEADIKEYAKYRNYEKQTKLCPHETSSYRADMKRIFQEIEKIGPEARYSVMNALESAGKMIEE